MSAPTFGSLFAGIGGADLGLERAGWRCAWQVEIDPACQRVLARHWPDVPRYSDICEVDGADLAPVDLIVFGSPCQDLSVAGRRAGLEGERSGLFYEAIRIIRAVCPTLALWENVPGALSSHRGRDFGAVLDALADAGALDCAWRILDAQWFGVAQRRRRLFVVADFRAERAAQVLFEPTSGNGHSTPRRETGACVAASLTAGAHGPGVNAPGRHHEDDVNLVVARCVTAGEGERLDGESCTFVIKGAAVGRAPENGPQYGEVLEDGTCYTLNCTEQHVVAHTLRAGAGVSEDGTGRGVPLVVTPFDTTQITSDKNYSSPRAGDPCHPLAAGMHAPAIAFHQTQDPISGDVAPRLGATSIGMGVQQESMVRRLTPRECERLQGLPDDWTAGESDSTRYRMLGNAMAVPVLEWLGRRLLEAAQ